MTPTKAITLLGLLVAAASMQRRTVISVSADGVQRTTDSSSTSGTASATGFEDATTGGGGAGAGAGAGGSDFAISTELMSSLIESRLNSSRYNRFVRPSADKAPLVVYINFEVNDISRVSEVDMEYTMSLFLRETWLDERLAFTEFNRSITLNYNQFDRIWSPDLFIRNLKSGILHSLTVPNRLIRLSPDGTIFLSQRLTLVLSCTMQLELYPMDNQTCKIEFGSYGYTVNDIIFNWRTDAPPVEFTTEMNLPEYIITNVSAIVCAHVGIGVKPCIRAYFFLSRRLKSYILSTFLPQFLVVLLSWLSFWIDPESAPARTSLSILTILTITTQSTNMMRGMPSGSVTKAIDVWMATCLVFVFGAFIEYSIVNTLVRKQKLRNAKREREQKSSLQCSNDEKSDITASDLNDVRENAFSSFRQRFCEMFNWHENPAQAVEYASRILFPVVFLIFNFVYWPCYLYLIKIYSINMLN